MVNPVVTPDGLHDPPTTPPLSPTSTLTAPTTPRSTNLSARPSQFQALLQDASDSFYLGAEAETFNSLKWVREGNTNRLVVLSPSASGGEPTSDSDDPEPQESAILSIVARVCDDDLYVSPDGFWKGPKVYPDGTVSKFCDTKMSFMVEPVVWDDYKQDWSTYVANAEALQAQVINEKSKACSGFLVVDKKKDGSVRTVLRLRHQVFVEVESPSEDDDEEDGKVRVVDKEAQDQNANEPTNDEQKELAAWTFDNWPVRVEARAALKALKEAETHQVNPLPVFDARGVLVPPDSYYRRLQGATVAIKFTLDHHHISAKKSDFLTASVVNIDIISPAKPKIQSPAKKRKLYSMRNSSRSPSKKPRATE